MIRQLSLQTPLQGRLDQTRDQATIAGHLNLASIDLGEQLIQRAAGQQVINRARRHRISYFRGFISHGHNVLPFRPTSHPLHKQSDMGLLHDLVTVEVWDAQGIGIRILNLGIDTSTIAGKLVLTIMSGLAEMEREVLRERTLDGLAAARRRGKHGGRPPALTKEQQREANRMRADGRSLTEIAGILGCSERTIRRVLAK